MSMPSATTTPDNWQSVFAAAGAPVRFDGARKRALETGRNRLVITGLVFALAFVGIGGRLIALTVDGGGKIDRVVIVQPETALASLPHGAGIQRADIVDRNGILLASSLPTVRVFADPKDVLDPAEAADRLVAILPELDRDTLMKRMTESSRFVWLTGILTPRQQYEVNRLGIPGIGFKRGERRVYPHGRLAAHVLGLTDIDGTGIAGVEQSFEPLLREAGEPLRLSLDIRVQAVVAEELAVSMSEFGALGGAALIMDANTAEILAMVSLPDFDPNNPNSIAGDAGFNRATKGVYEMGSTFKLFTAAMALDSGSADLTARYDATQPLQVARFTISDYHAENRWLSLPEILIHSSNIGAAQIAMDVGTDSQKSYLSAFGLLDTPTVELPEIGRPLVPVTWRDINTMTIGFGHGIAVSPLQMVSAVSALVNGGTLRPASIVTPETGDLPEGDAVISSETSRKMRALMRLVVEKGSGSKADVPGYLVGGKTGTAEKHGVGGYQRRALLSSFIAAFPMNKPRYVVFAMLDEPHGTDKTFGYATAGWTAAPVVRRVVSRIAPLVGMPPQLMAGDRKDGGKRMVAMEGGQVVRANHVVVE